MPTNNSIRRLPRFALVSKLKRAGVRQSDIALRAKVSQGQVSAVLGRRAARSDATERVWRAIETALDGRTA